MQFVPCQTVWRSSIPDLIFHDIPAKIYLEIIHTVSLENNKGILVLSH